MIKKAFTVAEVVITLAIIGVIAAALIPSVVASITQQEYRSGLKKAVSDLNSAISTGTTFGGDNPYSNADLFGYLTKYMSVIKSTTQLSWDASFRNLDGVVYKGSGNAAFYTGDGMRYEVLINPSGGGNNLLRLHESDYQACMASLDATEAGCGGCGSLGLKNNPNETTKPPCAILIDVNGDRRPSPTLSKDKTTAEPYKISNLERTFLSDVFVILITENRAIPYGVAAQHAMYNAKR